MQFIHDLTGVIAVIHAKFTAHVLTLTSFKHINIF